MKKIYPPIILMSLFLFARITLPSDFNWEIMTNVNDAKKIISYNSNLYVATDGGLIQYAISEDTYDVFTTEKGITDHNFTTVTATDKDMLIMGTINGILTFYDLPKLSLKEDFSLSGNEIISINSAEDTLWIALKDMIAVYLFNSDKNAFEFRDFFPNFNRDFERFHQVYYFDRKIWAASNNGLFYAPSNFLKYNLKSAENWTILTSNDGLPSNTIHSLISIDDTLFIGTEVGISKYVNQTFFNSGTAPIRNINTYGNNLYAGNTSNIYRLKGSQFQTIYQTSSYNINDFTIGDSEELWIALNEKGIFNPVSNRKLRFNGPVDNVMGHLYLNSRGELWVSSGIFGDQRNQGFSVLSSDGNWQNFQYFGNWRYSSNNQDLTEDAEGNMWIGSWNGGLLILDPERNIYHFNNYQTDGQLWISSNVQDDTVDVQPPDSTRHLLSYTVNAPDLLVVNSFLPDFSRDCMWLITLAVRDEKPLVCYNGNAFSEAAYDSTSWIKYDIPDYLGISGAPTAAITKDIFGNLWIGTDRQGVLNVQFHEDGTTEWFKIDETDNLKNNSCFALAGDLDGYVWLGTLNGLNAYFNGNLFNFREDYQPVGLQINDIFVDSENNKWFATNEGVSLLLARGSPFDSNSWVHFVPRTSEIIRDNLYYTNLPSKDIRGIYVDEKTGDVYCSTTSGLAVLRSNPFTTPLKELSRLKVGPNPITISDAKANYVYFRNLTNNSEVKILTATGRLVRTINLGNSNDFFGSFARWDCRNQDGRLVSSGVYLFLITDEAGNSNSGKMMLIRE
jgi:ligand-binding sensor domain-containing protein